MSTLALGIMILMALVIVCLAILILVIDHRLDMWKGYASRIEKERYEDINDD